MKTYLTIFFAILAIILLFGMIGDSEEINRINYTNAFSFVIVAIIAINVIPLFL